MYSTESPSNFTFCGCSMLQQKLDQPVSGPSSPRNSQVMMVDVSSSEVADNLVQSIQALKAEVSRLHGLLRASQVERMYPFTVSSSSSSSISVYRAPITNKT